MKKPILYTARGCKFCPDVKSYAELAGVELDVVRLSESNPHGLRSAPAIEHKNVLTYTDKPLLAGFTDDVNVEQVAGAAGLIAHSYGKGSVIGMTDNPVFRGYWYGTSRLLSNALFFGNAFHAAGD